MLSSSTIFDAVNVPGPNTRLAIARTYLYQCVIRVQAVKFQLRYNGIAIRRKRVVLNQYLAALAFGPEKTDHHQVQIDRQRIGDHHFKRACAN